MPQDEDDDLTFPGYEVVFALNSVDERTLHQELDRHLDALRNWLERDGKAFHALEAMGVIAASVWGRDDLLEAPGPNTPVSVPWWVVDVLGSVWSQHKLEGKPIDSALGSARGGISKYGRDQRDRGLALEIAMRLARTGETIEKIIWDLEEERGIGLRSRAIWAAWERYGQSATATVRKVRRGSSAAKS